MERIFDQYKGRAFDEPAGPQYKGRWRKLFNKTDKAPLHLEIGPGNGKHFAKLCLNRQEHCFLAVELRYKALAQTVRRLDKRLCQNGAVIRYDASFIDEIFAEGELNNVYIFFPDPWTKKRRQKKRRLISAEFCQKLYKLTRPGSFLEFKTDSEEYFRQSLKLFQSAGYEAEGSSLDFYQDFGAPPALEDLSWFELLFYQKQIPIRYIYMRRPL